MADRHPLILSGLAHDIHAAAVIWGLQQQGLSPLWIRSWADSTMPPMSMYCDPQSGVRARYASIGAGIGSVWFRRPRNPETFPHAHEADLPFLRNEWGRFINNIHALDAELTDALWVNRPAAAANAENKLVQLHAARRAGLPFPATLMSSDPVEIRRFVGTHRRVVYKPFQTHTWQDASSGKMFSTYARIVDADMLHDDASLRQCPGIYQQVVDKHHDVRVTIIGDHLFPIRLDTPLQGDFVDWRIGSLADTMRARPTELPSGFPDMLHRLMRELGIVFGCVDLAIDGDGHPHFLEVNQAGQFLFLEQAAPAMPILRAMCALLAQGRSDYSIDALSDVSYADYLASDEHGAWWESVRDGIKGTDGAIPGVSVE
ncbi:hypothetical protein [Marilutibacter chinensis]|uniref:ATP-grasp domain-containing protein n=1 Tax=Marilutibacter chinensis TaxID=2912247 RepID=A0ABS9HY98_9GAMM|nr:hypothetical protein [Lysobacter chinensis]MCF7223144.1 hypothetical protein [Lysobacter chinensis]